MQVIVRDNNVDQALKALKKKMQREGIFREMKLRGHYRKALREAGPREGGSHPPRPQAGPQARPARKRHRPEAGDPAGSAAAVSITAGAGARAGHGRCRLRYSALTMLSTIFLASPNSIIVLSR